MPCVIQLLFGIGQFRFCIFQLPPCVVQFFGGFIQKLAGIFQFLSGSIHRCFAPEIFCVTGLPDGIAAFILGAAFRQGGVKLIQIFPGKGGTDLCLCGSPACQKFRKTAALRLHGLIHGGVQLRHGAAVQQGNQLCRRHMHGGGDLLRRFVEGGELCVGGFAGFQLCQRSIQLQFGCIQCLFAGVQLLQTFFICVPTGPVVLYAFFVLSKTVFVVGDTVVVFLETVFVFGKAFFIVQFALFQLGDTVVIFLETVFVFGKTFFIVQLALFQLGDTVIVFLEAVFIFGKAFRVVQLALFQIGNAIVVFLETVFILGKTVCVVQLAFFQFPDTVCIVDFALFVVLETIGVFLFAVQQLLIGVCQLFLCIGPLCAVFRPAVGQFLFAVPDLVHGIGVQGVVAQLCPLCQQRFHVGLQCIGCGGVSVGISGGIIGHGEIDLVIGLRVKGFLRHQHKGGDAAAADGSGSPVDVEIQGRCGDACQRILVIPQQIQRVLVVDGGNADGLSNVVSSEVGCIAQTFAAGFRHPSGDQFGMVHIVRQTVRNEDKLTVCGVLPEKFRIPGAVGGLYALQRGKGIHILPGKSQSGEQPEVVEIVCIQIFLPGGQHGGLAHPQTGEEADAQPHNGQNGQKPPQTLPDLPQGGFQQCCYHSISSTLMGASLTASLTTMPFFTRMTRSAMAVRALLWVMIITVTPL